MKNDLKMAIAASVASLFLFSCVRAEKDQSTRLTLNIPADLGSKPISSSSLNSNITPASLSEINCFAVLVTGTESGMSRNTCHYKTSGDAFQVGKFYGGFFKGSAANASMTFEVPNGLKRIVRLIGFKVDTSASTAASLANTGEFVCANFLNREALQKFMSDPYILKEQPDVDMKGDPVTLDLTATLNTNFKVGDCKGPDFPDNDDSSGKPYKFGLSFQDEVGTASKKLSSGDCVGVRVQIQDQNGNRADMSSNPTIIGKINTVATGTPLGYFYHTGGSYGCAAGTEMTPVSGDVTFTFKNGGTAFSDFLMFFRPTDALSTIGRFTVSQASGGSSEVIQPAILPYIFDMAGSTTPLYYHVYDLFNNRSTLSANTYANRMIIKANECRQAAVQFADGYGVPTAATSTSGSYKSIVVTPSNPVMMFYANSSDCSNSANGTAYFSGTVTPFSVYGSYNFYYKVVGTTTPVNFSFGVTNGGGGGQSLVSSGDLMTGANYWEAQ